jgi:hypothetical protein
LDSVISHDQVSRFLSMHEFDSKSLWLKIKHLVRQYENTDTCLIFDDTIVKKQYMDENELICWHWAHCNGCHTKVVNILSAFYVSSLPSTDECSGIPVAYELIKKTVIFSKIKTRKQKRQSPVTKNELMHRMIAQQIRNRVKFKYVLSDTIVCFRR